MLPLTYLCFHHNQGIFNRPGGTSGRLKSFQKVSKKFIWAWQDIFLLFSIEIRYKTSFKPSTVCILLKSCSNTQRYIFWVNAPPTGWTAILATPPKKTESQTWGVLGLCFFSSPHVWDSVFWVVVRIAVHPVSTTWWEKCFKIQFWTLESAPTGKCLELTKIL